MSAVLDASYIRLPELPRVVGMLILGLFHTPPSTAARSVPFPIMKLYVFSVMAALAAREVLGHATFQQLWVDGVDMISLGLSL